MAPKKKSGKKKQEVLEDPKTLKDGQHSYYIGGWSAYQKVECIGEISAMLIAEHTGEDREVQPIPRTNIMLLPSTGTKDEEAEVEEEEKDDMVDIEVADKMHIEGVSRLTVKRSVEKIKDWKRQEPVVEEAAEVISSARTTASAGGRKKKKASSVRISQVDEEAAAAAAAVAAAPLEENAEESHQEAAATAQEESAVEEKEQVMEVEQQETTKEDVIDESIPAPVGADFTARHACIHGEIRILGSLPQMVVKPQLPTPPTIADPAAAAAATGSGGNKGSAGSSKSRSKKRGSSGSRKKKTKLTPEQLEELERQRAAAEALFLQQTEEAIELAKQQEEYLMTFAHPNRWASVVFSNITFTGPVEVHGAHVSFNNCCFTSKDANKPQLLISQYCRVDCIKCSFDAPVLCGLYALPAAEVSAKKCFFSGEPQVSLYTLGVDAPASVRKGGAQVGGFSNTDGAVASAEEVDEDDRDDRSSIAGGGTSGVNMPEGSIWELNLTPELEAVAAAIKLSRPTSVGVHTDCAKVSVDACRFLFLGTGVLLRGRFQFAPRLATLRGLPKTKAHMVVSSCRFNHMYSTALVVERNAEDVLIQKNRYADCEYYGLDCHRGMRDVSIYKNDFSVGAQVRFREGAQPQFLHNRLHSIPIDDNKHENPCMETCY